MSKPLPTLPNKSDPRFLEFCDFLRDEPVRPAARLAPGNYENHLAVLEVFVDPQPNCDLGYCWFNCLDQQYLHGGEVVYGWSLWSCSGVYIAQHHAIWRMENGALIDPTPNQGLVGMALFMPDNRAPFDIHGLRSPPNLEWLNSKNFKWLMGTHEQTDFFIGAMRPAPDQKDRVDRTRKRYLDLV